MSCNDGDSREHLESSISTLLIDIQCDITFLTDGLESTDAEYTAKFNKPTTSKHTLKTLCWERVEYNTLLQQAHSIKSNLEMLLSNLCPESPRTGDVIKSMKNVKSDLLKYFRNVYIKRRQPAATHILVFLLSEERRNKKPYALPIQYIPYKSIRDQFIRDMNNEIKTVMVSMGMRPVGKYCICKVHVRHSITCRSTSNNNTHTSFIIITIIIIYHNDDDWW